MPRISIVDLEVFFTVGVPDEERAKPQRLLITVDMEFDFSIAAINDRVNRTIDYAQVVLAIQKLGEDHSWKLIEKLATDISDEVMSEFKPQGVYVEVKKFVIPQARYVSVSLIQGQMLPAIRRAT